MQFDATVPVARDRAGGLVVYDLPSFAPAAVRAVADPPTGEALVGAERAPIWDVVTRFMRSYLAGDTDGLRYLVPAGTRITAVADRLELVDVASIAAIGPAPSDGRLVVATVHVRDAKAGVVYVVRYRPGLVRRDRWYVAELNSLGRSRG